MKAVVIHRHGTLDQVRIDDVPTPRIRRGEVLVETRAAALNHLDLFVVEGIPGIKQQLPHVLGSDAAGVVRQLGAGVEGLQAGDRVMLNPGIWCTECEFCQAGEQSLCARYGLVGEHGPGVYSEFFAAPARNLARIPDGVTFEEAAAFSLVNLTAWRMVCTRGRLKPGEDVFIHGIGGGVASAALAIAKLSGARIRVSSSSSEKLEQARRLGADFCYDYTQCDVAREVFRNTNRRGVDLVVEGPGASTWLQSLKMVRKGGRIVTCGATTGPNPATEIRLIFWKQIDILGSTMGNQQEFAEIVRLLGRRKLLPCIDRIFDFEDASAALEHLQSQRQFGKVVLRLDHAPS
jgi:NADPH:quinone reductase-like Zn-dependent oxidoreductase